MKIVKDDICYIQLKDFYRMFNINHVSFSKETNMSIINTLVETANQKEEENNKEKKSKKMSISTELDIAKQLNSKKKKDIDDYFKKRSISWDTFFKIENEKDKERISKIGYIGNYFDFIDLEEEKLIKLMAKCRINYKGCLAAAESTDDLVEGYYFFVKASNTKHKEKDIQLVYDLKDGLSKMKLPEEVETIIKEEKGKVLELKKAVNK